MPFHLTFELYPVSVITSSPKLLEQLQSIHPENIPQTTATQKSHIPRDIFEKLPSHHGSEVGPGLLQRGRRASSFAGKKAARPPKLSVKPKEEGKGVPPTPATPTKVSFQAEKDNKKQTQQIDQRPGPVSVDWMDYSAALKGENSEPKGTKHGAPTRQPPKGQFIPLNGAGKGLESGTAELGIGIVHLYRSEDDEHPVPEALTTSQNLTEEDKVVAILAVPSYMTASDFLGFLTPEARDGVSHFRMIRTAAPNRYMVLMKFREADSAKAFQAAYNGRPFNSMEPETAHAVFIKSITFQSSTSPPPSFSYLLDDPFTPESSPLGTGTGTIIPTPPHSKPLPPPTPALRELPTCPVCLERMDASVTGLLTILCQHTFHCQCLSKWGDSTCPVCRYSQKKDVATQSSEASRCGSCGAVSNLWICLICGNIGCGRYDEAHAYSHYVETNHLYALELQTQRVWDYVNDSYVHRLIQNKADGKLVELPSASSTGPGVYAPAPQPGDYVPRDKLDAVGLEYTYLLQSQLDSQRQYYEDKLLTAVDKASGATADAEKIKAKLEETTVALSVLQVEHATLTREILPKLESEKNKAEAKAAKLTDMVRTMEKEWREEKSMNKSILERVNFLMKDKEERDKELAEMREQVTDLMMALTMRDRVEASGEGVGGDIEVREAPKPNRKPRKKK
ncbi:hypothetical protein YB2330_001552 [Saitoella coloradoensis]